MPGMMKQEIWRGSPAKEGVCPKSSKSEVERKSHSLKCTNSGVPPEKLNFLTKKFPQISPGKHLLISISGFGGNRSVAEIWDFMVNYIFI